MQLTRSDLEILFLERIDAAGLPRPLVNTTIDGMEVDFCWPDHRAIVETDGWAYEDVVHEPEYVTATLRALLGH